ncbi:shikimate dehydrogenase [Actibacterium ureilyticum]|uniref:shikimate dehydrogenase n=1 Tax=Actibacterium ureilyticum TaxID=1590614 RepID=UPI000BAAAAE0|nr:shikimate dehydrogenase [Actibacterium ureilyticum]
MQPLETATEPCALLRTGLVGKGIALSRTPAMHMAEAQGQGLCCDYRLHDMDAPENAGITLAQKLDQLEQLGYAGVNVTYPYKIAVIDHLTEMSENAAAVGAVNTVVFRDGKRCGHNTDLWGFAEGFRREFGNTGHDHALLVGAGGAGVAVAHALIDCGIARLSIHDTDPDRAAQLAHQVTRNRPGARAQITEDIAALIARDRPQGVVNATPMGMAKLPGSAFPVALLSADMWVADIVYFPLETELLRGARARGCRTLEGAGMAVYQAVRAFELFTGRPADPQRMKATFDAFDHETRILRP